MGEDCLFEVGHLDVDRVPTHEEIEALAIDVLRKNRQARIIAVHVDARVRWPGPTHIQLGETRFTVRRARSLLEFRGYLATHETNDSGLICLVSVEDRELSLDLRVRLARRGLLALEPRRAQHSRFRVFDLKPEE